MSPPATDTSTIIDPDALAVRRGGSRANDEAEKRGHLPKSARQFRPFGRLSPAARIAFCCNASKNGGSPVPEFFLQPES